ncbi:MAG: hypothetical protein IPL59_14865 [Candidatus Competibacteraceae bacterium]|nr:hypothetical protein [Candidatus Competibacteraceae bacterium]MBK8752475.1 hypothetical protein [Candidatus Competibacteraceae bacterium]
MKLNNRIRLLLRPLRMTPLHPQWLIFRNEDAMFDFSGDQSLKLEV